MGSLTIEIPQKINRTFRVTDEKFATELLRELESQEKNKGVFDDVLGIWANRSESSEELTKNLREKSNKRDG